MFWDNWIPKKYLAKSEICAIEACFRTEYPFYYYTLLKNKNKKLEITESGSCDNKLKLPAAILKNKTPLVLIVNGNGIIHKKINLSENTGQDFEDIIRKNMPAVNTDDFYVQLYKQSDPSAFIVLCRKQMVDKLILDLKNNKYDLALVLLGPTAILGLEPLWGNHNALFSSFHRIELSNGLIDTITSDLESKKEMVKIDELSFSPNFSLGFAGGLSYLMQRPIAESNNKELINIRQQHLEKNKFHFLMLFVVGIAFALAFVNVVFYTSYFDKNNKLETELSVFQGKYEQINQLLSDYQKNKNLIENAGVLNKNKLSEFADRIGKTLPEEVVLSELYFNPKNDNEESLDSLITFQNKSLILKGNCSKSFIVNEWINVLKMQKFIKVVSLEKFIYSNEGLIPNFEVKLITE